MIKLNTKSLFYSLLVIVIVISVIFLVLWSFTINETPKDDDGVPKEVPIASGGETKLKVQYYDDMIWDKKLGNETDPEDLFGWGADIINSTSKCVIKGRENGTLDIFDIVEILIGKTWSEPNKVVLRDTYNLYGKWEAWMFFLDYWNFTIYDFNEDADKDIILPIFQNTEDFSEILKEFQDLSPELNIGSNITAKLLIYYMVIKSLPMLKPVDIYIQNIINVISPSDIEFISYNDTCCVNISYFEEEYYINANYSKVNGMIQNLMFFDENQSIFYYQYGFYTKALGAIPSYIILYFSLSFIIGIIGIIYIINKKKGN